MFAVIDLYQREVVAIETAPSAMDKCGFHFCLAPVKRRQLDYVEASAIDMPFVEDRDETAHGFTRLNSTTHAHGLAAHASAPLILDQRSRNAGTGYL